MEPASDRHCVACLRPVRMDNAAADVAVLPLSCEGKPQDRTPEGRDYPGRAMRRTASAMPAR
jgi:hypothetical protein